MKILFVCEDNRARSQMAECIFNRLRTRKEDKAESVGTEVKNLKKINEYPLIKECMEEAGFNLGSQKPKKLTKKKIKEANLVVLMNPKLELPKYIEEAKELEMWNVQDPKGRDINVYRKVRDDVHILVNRLIDKIEKLEDS